MFKTVRNTLITAFIVTAAAGAQASVNPKASFGMAANTDSADRHIVIKPDTKWVNVNNGDTVEFQVNGKSFTWHFDTLHSEEAFSLSKIAPEGVDAGMVTVYVAPNPLYQG